MQIDQVCNVPFVEALFYDQNARMTNVNVPELRPATPRIVKKLEVFDVVSDKDPTILIGNREVLVVACALGTDFARRSSIVPGEAEVRDDVAGNVVVEI